MKKTNKTKQSGKAMELESSEKRSLTDGYITIPSFVFRDRSVAVLESLVEYLHDNKKLSFHEISLLLNRDDRTIWTVYNRVKKKRGKNI